MILKRVLNMHGKEKTKHSLLLFLNALQRKIIEKKLRKSSPNAKLIEGIQKWAMATYNKMGPAIVVNLEPKTLDKLHAVVGSERIRDSVRFIKRYIALHGKWVDKDRVARLHKAISKAIDTRKITKTDPYYDKLQAVLESLKTFSCDLDGKRPLQIHPATLQGLQGLSLTQKVVENLTA